MDALDLKDLAVDLAHAKEMLRISIEHSHAAVARVMDCRDEVARLERLMAGVS